MFDIGWSELLLIGVVALIAIGPKELPGALRTFGQGMAKIRRMAAEFRASSGGDAKPNRSVKKE
jgi:sec-independent protein translocase protein TatB